MAATHKRCVYSRTVFSLLLLLLATSAWAGTFTADGPRTFTRTSGQPAAEVFAFQVQDPSARYELKIDNDTVSSAIVLVNGVEIFGTKDFSQQVKSLVKPITLTASNQLSVELRGAPDEKMTVTVIGYDEVPPVIRATPEPAANAAGWWTGNVTVHFSCSDATSGIAVCPAPVVIGSEGRGQEVSGVARDRAGNTNVASLHLNIDKSAPTVQIVSPADGALVESATVAISGTVSDVWSDVARVTCNGQPATLAAGRFDCSVNALEGESTVNIVALDGAGNSGTTPLRVRVSTTPRVTLLEPSNQQFVSISPVTVRGTVTDPRATVTINGVAAVVSGTTFLATVPLVEGNNTLSAVARSTSGRIGTGSVQVTLDTTPPRAAVTSPASGFETAEASIAVAGIVNDIVVGTVNEGQARVTINGVEAAVANRTFVAPNVPLNPGNNVIQVIARDQVGNQFTSRINVIRLAPGQPAIGIAGGNLQSGRIGSMLAQPLTVVLRDAGGQPVANKAVVFKVTDANGMLSNGGAPAPWLAVYTDAGGRASAQYTLGTRAGAGNNKVQATATGFAGTAVFVASASTTAATAINIDAGQGQTGAVKERLAFPFVVVVTDAGHNRVGGVPVTFRVTGGGGNIGGETTVTRNTDSDGRALVSLTLGEEQGFDSHIVEANIASNPGHAAVFTATAKVAGNETDTKVVGVVLDNSNRPLAGVTMRLYRAYLGSASNIPQSVAEPVVTNAHGQFVMPNAPIGAFKLVADGTTVPGPNRYPPVEFDLVTVAGQENGVGLPIYLPVLDNVNRLCVDEALGGTLTLPSVPGFSFTVAPGSATFPGGSRSGCITVTPVHGDKVPMVPGFGQQPRFVVTIQPVGTHFNPPAQISFPNVDGLAPREVTEMYSYDHDLATFIAIGTATVSADGSTLRSDAGVGVMKAGWHCGGNPNQTGAAATCPKCQKCEGPSCRPDPAQAGAGCDDKKFCTENDRCQNGACKGDAVAPETKPSFSQSINFEKAVEPIKNLLRNKLGYDADFAFQGTIQFGSSRECCEKKRAKVDNATITVGATGGLQMQDWPVPGLAGKLPFRLGEGGLFFTASVSGSVSGTFKEDDCEAKPKGILQGQVQGQIGAKVVVLKLPDDVVNISFGASGGIAGGIQGTIQRGLIEGQLTGGHTGVVGAATLQLLNGVVEYTGTVTLIEPGTFGDATFAIPFNM